MTGSSEGLPTVGVIIPNNKRFVELSQALSSVERQTYTGEVTVYLVYEPREEIEPLVEGLHPDVHPIPFRHGEGVAGIAARRNVGLDASSEDWIALLDDDDLWHPEKLSRQIEAVLRDPEAVAVATGFVKFRSPGPPKWPTGKRSAPKTMSRYEIARSSAVATTSMIFRGAVARELRFDERPEWLGVDDYLLRLQLSEIGSLIRLQEILTAMRTDDASASRERRALQYARSLDVLARWLKQGHRDAPLRAAFLVKCLFTSLVPGPDDDPEASSALRAALDGQVFGRLDPWIVSGIERGWSSRRVVPALHKLLSSKAVQRFRGIRVSNAGK